MRLFLLALLMTGIAVAAQPLPEPVLQALQRAAVPPEAVAVVVADVAPSGRVWVRHRAEEPVNPASVMKLVTTAAALDRLGPAYTWRTTVHVQGSVRDGTLAGTLYLRGGGDPKLVVERLWLLLQRVREGLGIRAIDGDIVLDRLAFALPPHDPAAFDGEPLRPYNVGPDALLVNFGVQGFTFVPHPFAGVARVQLEPALAGVTAPSSVPLVGGACGDWRASLRADFSDALRPRFVGRYPLSCGVQTWAVAYPQPQHFAARAVAGLWAQLGGQLTGVVRDGTVPVGLAPRLVFESVPLAEVVRDVNKFSNNVMAQHLLLSLALPVPEAGASRGASHRHREVGGPAQASSAVGAPLAEGGTIQRSAPPAAPPATFDAARAALLAWWQQRFGPELPPPVVDNGAGLSREARITAAALARLLQWAWASPWMPDLLATLPVSGVDGTLRRSPMGQGIAHLKTGSLADVQALAGVVHGPDGQRRVLVAIVNHPNARAAHPALDALVQWTAGLP